MEECAKCGVLGDKKRLFDGILNEGIMKVCEDCVRRDDIPVVKMPTTFQLKESEKEPMRYRDYVKRFEGRRVPSEALKKQETTLKEIVDKNVKVKIEKESKPRLDLIDNFHWIIMRARRAKKLSQGQLAKAIAESEMAIKLAETGKFPDDDYRLVNKLETYLGIRLVKKETADRIIRQPKRLEFDAHTTKILTVEDLREMKKERESKKVGKDEKPEFGKKDSSDDREMTPEEVEDLIFRGGGK